MHLSNTGEVSTDLYFTCCYRWGKYSLRHRFIIHPKGPLATCSLVQRDAASAALVTYFPLPLSLLNGFLKP